MQFFNFQGKRNGFTFVELVVSFVISSIILSSLFYFISANVDEITKSNIDIGFNDNLNEFINKMSYFSNIYDSGSIIIDNLSGTGSDAYLFKYSDNSAGIIVGVVVTNTGKIEKLKEDYEKYYDKVLGYRLVSGNEINQIISNTSLIYDYKFFDEKIFKQLRVKDFQVDLYNSGSIINMDITFINNYKDINEGKYFSSVKGEKYFKVNLAF